MFDYKNIFHAFFFVHQDINPDVQKNQANLDYIFKLLLHQIIILKNVCRLFKTKIKSIKYGFEQKRK